MPHNRDLIVALESSSVERQMTLEEMQSYPSSPAMRHKAESGQVRTEIETGTAAAKPERRSGQTRSEARLGQDWGETKYAIPRQAMDD